MPVQHKRNVQIIKMEKEGSTLLCDMLEDMLALANSVCLLALSSGMYEREIAARHGTARRCSAQLTSVPILWFYVFCTYIPWDLVFSYDTWYIRIMAEHHGAEHGTARRSAKLLYAAELSYAELSC